MCVIKETIDVECIYAIIILGEIVKYWVLSKKYARIPPLQKRSFKRRVCHSDRNGKSELWDFLDDLQKHAINNKDVRIQHRQIVQYIQLLEDHGTRLGENILKHLDENIWELRQGKIVLFSFTLKVIFLYFYIYLERKHVKLHFVN